VWNIYNIMKEEDVEEKHHDFMATLCRQIVWAILDDGRGFFNKRLYPDKFKMDHSLIPFPRLLLDAIYPNVRWQEPINHRMLARWTTQRMAQDTRSTGLMGAGLSDFGNRSYGLAGSLYWHGGAMGVAGTTAHPGTGYLPPPPPAGLPPQFRPQPEQSSTDKLAHVHPVLR
jgi:hypothetical protein